MPQPYDVGETTRVMMEFTNRATLLLTDPDALTVEVFAPPSGANFLSSLATGKSATIIGSGTIYALTDSPSHVIKEATGKYHLVIKFTITGVWVARAVGTFNAASPDVDAEEAIGFCVMVCE